MLKEGAIFFLSKGFALAMYQTHVEYTLMVGILKTDALQWSDNTENSHHISSLVLFDDVRIINSHPTPTLIATMVLPTFRAFRIIFIQEISIGFIGVSYGHIFHNMTYP